MVDKLFSITEKRTSLPKGGPTNFNNYEGKIIDKKQQNAFDHELKKGKADPKETGAQETGKIKR